MIIIIKCSLHQVTLWFLNVCLALVVRAKFCSHSNQWGILQTSMRKRLKPPSAAKAFSLSRVTLQEPSLSVVHVCKPVAFLTLAKQETLPQRTLRCLVNYLLCIFTPKANLNPSMARDAVLRSFVVG